MSNENAVRPTSAPKTAAERRFDEFVSALREHGCEHGLDYLGTLVTELVPVRYPSPSGLDVTPPQSPPLVPLSTDKQYPHDAGRGGSVAKPQTSPALP